MAYIALSNNIATGNNMMQHVLQKATITNLSILSNANLNQKAFAL